ncbi:YrzI family small protein [Thalassobacillus sp. CUG 92003]
MKLSFLIFTISIEKRSLSERMRANQKARRIHHMMNTHKMKHLNL